MPEVGGIAADKLKQMVERIEALTEDKAAIQGDIKDVFAEAKALGFDLKALREVIKIRKRDQQERDEMDALVATYMHALGMLADTPLGGAALRRLREVA